MRYDVAVVGAGVFGAWTAYQLHLNGASVLLLDAYGPGNSRASSGGESRMIRLGYGPDEIYSRSAQRSLVLWQQLFAEVNQPHLFQRTGILWLARAQDPYCEATLTTLRRIGAICERLDHDELARRFTQLNIDPISWGILESESGVLLARRAVKAVADEAVTAGVHYVQDAIAPPQVDGNELHSIRTTSGNEIEAERFVFACGPWLPKLFPDLLGELIHVTRQEVFFFGVTPADESFNAGMLPAWIDFNDLVYGLPNIEGRGFKIAIDAHGPEFDPDAGERVVSASGLTAAREYLAQRVPRLANAPVTETRVCQYENTSNGDLLIDRHPAFENVWLVGGGSGHGFKHGPAVGEYVVAMIAGTGAREERFGLANKRNARERKVY
ncbi:MAG TPA: FAD-dependent oxidoreductase [Pyrinomonadaceae bacterium]|nr:FAD-dependent oxidoreductase [Pyrinomonadaceae bacterium]